MKKYTIKTSEVKNGVGEWSSTLCEIYDGENKLGQYTRNYYSHAESTFVPFEMNGKEYALYSKNYTQISLMSLPDCKDIPMSDKCKEQMAHFCPVGIHIPQYFDYTYKIKEEDIVSRLHLTDSKDLLGVDVVGSGYSSLGFTIGCVWGDDSSWKLNLIDLRDVEKGEIWFIDNTSEKKWLYEQFPSKAKLEDIAVEFGIESIFPEGYTQLKEDFVWFN